jgi:hypothetical protein
MPNERGKIMTTATLATTEVRDELLERITNAHANLQTLARTSTLAANDYNEYQRLNAKMLALTMAAETIMAHINADDIEQFNVVKAEMFKAHRTFTDNDFNAKTAGGRSGYSLVIDYMRYSIGCLAK